MNKLSVVFLMFVFLLSFTSAYEFDNVISENSKLKESLIISENANKYPALKIDNVYGLGKNLATMALTEHTETCGIDCLSEFTISITEDSALIDDIKFLKLDNNKWINSNIRSYQFYIKTNEESFLVDDYETQCQVTGTLPNGTKIEECSQVNIGSHLEKKPLWEVYSLKDIKTAGTYEIKLEGKKRPDWTYDWQITTQGKLIEEWATWGNISTGSQAEVRLNSPTNNSIQYTRQVTTNASGNVTGGAYLTNATLYDNSTGTWGSRNTTNMSPIGANNLVAYYKLDETTGTIVNSEINNASFYGRNVNQHINSAGKIGGAYYRNATNQYVNLGNASAFWENTTFSINYWVNTTKKNWMPVSNLVRDNSNFYYGWYTQIADTGNFKFMTAPGQVTMSEIDSGIDVTNGQWHMVTATYSASGTNASIYVDGILKNTTSLPLPLFNGVRRPTINGFYASNGTTYEQWGQNATHDEIGFWNGILTQEDITELYNSGNGLAYSETTGTFTNTYPAGSNIKWNYKFCDSDGVCGFATSNYTFSIDGIAPIITLNYPTTLINYGGINQTLQLNFTATDTNLDKVWYMYKNDLKSSYVYNASVNQTIYSTKPYSNSYVNILFDNGGAIYNNAIVDTSSCDNVSLYSRSVGGFPTTYIISVLCNGTIIGSGNGTITDRVNFYEGGNVTITGATSGFYNLSNITLSNKKNITIYANDTAGNLNTSLFTWDYKVFENSRTFNSATRSGDQEDYYLNLTLYTGIDLTAVEMIYNGSTLYPSITSSGQNRIIAEEDYAVPIFESDSNVTFYYHLTLNDATEINTTSSVQLIEAVFIDNCSTYTYPLFNISLFDEEAKTPLYGDIEFNYQLNVPGYDEIYALNMSFTNVQNISLCSESNLSEDNFAQSVEIRYSADGYSAEFYHIQGADISGQAQVINLFDLNSSDSTTFKITYQDSDFIFVSDAIVQLQRKYISEDLYEVVEAPITSSDGNAILHIDLDSVKYRVTIVKNGVVLNDFDNIVFKCQSELTGECDYKLLGQINPQNDEDYDTSNDFHYSDPTSDNDSIEISFSVPSSSPASVNFVIEQRDQWGNKTLCNKTITTSAGSLSCDYEETLGDSYIDLYLYKDNVPVARKSYILPASSGLNWLENNYIFVIILLFSLVGMALTSPEWIIVNGIVTMVIAGGLWLVNGMNFAIGLGNIIWLVVAGIILISKLSKQEDR